jgi:hypothetical protein
VGGIILYDKLGIRKEAVVAYFKLLAQYVPGMTDENHRKP